LTKFGIAEVHHSRTPARWNRAGNAQPGTAVGRSNVTRTLLQHPLLRLAGRLKPIAWQAGGAYGATVAAMLVSLAVPRVLGLLVDAALGEDVPGLAWLPGAGTTAGLVWGAGLLVAIAIARAGLSFVQRYGTAWVGRTVATGFRRDVFDQLLRLDVAFHDRSSVGQLMTRVTDDTDKVRQFAAVAVAELLSIAVLLIGALVLLTALDPVLAWVALAPLPVLAALAVLGARRLSPRFLDVQQATGRLTARLQESLAQIRVLQAFTAEGRTGDRYVAGNEDLYGKRLGLARIFTTVFPAMSGILGLTSAAVLLIGGRRVIAGELTIGTLLAFNSYIFLLGQPVRRLGFFLNLASRASVSARRVYELLDLEPALAPGRDDLAGARGRVSWEGVDFAFGEGDELVLRDITLDVERGEHVAVVGVSGAGKTTLVNLLIRLYDPLRGTVAVDGRDLRGASREGIRDVVGFVEQDAFLFSATVAENVEFARPGATREQVERACRLAGAHDFVMDLEDGYDTVIGERGVTLSGGQRQRIALARALVMEPRVLVLDDAISAVDARTEERIRASLRESRDGRTLVTVAQRLSTILSADRIVMLERGRIVERGTHRELLAAGGPYARLFRATAAATTVTEEVGA
jgi:ATP-binding cassette subfamily B protein